MFPSKAVFPTHMRTTALYIDWSETLLYIIHYGHEDLLEKETATHCSVLAWKIPWTEEPGGLQSMGSQRVGHDRVTSLSLSLHEAMSFYRNLRITGITDTTLWDRMLKCKSMAITSGDEGKPGNSQNVLQPEGAAVLTLLLPVNASSEFWSSIASFFLQENTHIWIHPYYFKYQKLF